MTWFRIDDQFTDHPKVMRLRMCKGWQRALALWTLAGAWSSRQLTDGRVPEGVAALLGCARADAEALVEVGLWDRAEDGYVFHGWHDHNPTKAHVEEERAKTRERVAKWKAKRRGGNGSDGDNGNAGDTDENAKVTPLPQRSSAVANAAVTVPPARPDPLREEPPFPLSNEKRSRDPMLTVSNRPDVLEVHAAWKLACDFPQHRFRGAYDTDAGILADAIEAHGLAECLLVAEHAPNDGMVSGKRDERGTKHDTIRYIFGNADTFARIQRAAQEALGRSSRKRSASEVAAEAKRL